MTINVIRNIVGGGGSSNIDNRVDTNSSPPNLFKAVVVESFLNPETLTTEQKNTLKSRVQNPIFVDLMPANSLLVRVVSTGLDLQNNSPLIVFPIFSSHFQLPIIPGEQVFVIFEDYNRDTNQLGYWLDRIHELIQVEDLNYTHGDRRFNSNLLGQADDRLSERNNNQQPNNSADQRLSLQFPNGANTTSTFTLTQQENNRVNPFDDIVNTSLSYRLFVPEPVPRWIRRPNELVIQSNNNSAIVLGSDRIGSINRVADEQINYAGAIDIVCGRGRDMIPYAVEREPNSNESTSPFVANNSRNKLEVDKNPTEIRKTRNINEGNPSFINDAARIYIGMNTFGDKNFQLENINSKYPDNTLFPANNEIKDGGLGNSYIISKADNVRIIARKNENKNINGTIFFIKEGAKNQDLSFMFFNSEGKVQLEGKEIFFGKATRKNEPYIKWSVYKQHIDKLKEQITELSNHVKYLAETYNTAFGSSNAIPYSPIQSLVINGNRVKIQTDTKIANINNEIAAINPDDAKSIKLFGE